MDFPQVPADASPELVAKWERFMQGIVTHWEPRVEHLVNNISTVKSAIQGASCSTADAAAQNVVETVREFNRNYNEQTDCGKNQGARFP